MKTGWNTLVSGEALYIVACKSEVKTRRKTEIVEFGENMTCAAVNFNDEFLTFLTNQVEPGFAWKQVLRLMPDLGSWHTTSVQTTAPLGMNIWLATGMIAKPPAWASSILHALFYLRQRKVIAVNKHVLLSVIEVFTSHQKCNTYRLVLLGEWK